MPGYLKVNVSAFGGIIPVRNACVQISTDNKQIIKSLLTDEDGNTIKISLPSGSDVQKHSDPVPAKYYVSVQADGYASYPEREVLIFENIVTMLYSELIPEEMI